MATPGDRESISESEISPVESSLTGPIVKSAPVQSVEGPKTWAYVHATTDNPAEDGIWKAINDRIGWGYSGVSGTREMVCNEDIRRAIEAVRAESEARIADLEASIYRTNIALHRSVTLLTARADRARLQRDVFEHALETIAEEAGPGSPTAVFVAAALNAATRLAALPAEAGEAGDPDVR